MLRLAEIKSVHVELTTQCNARCPMCPRNMRGCDYNSGYPITELSFADFKHIFRPDFLESLGTPDHRENGTPMDPQPWYKGFKFNGNLGDFSSARDAVEIVKYLVDHGVAVQICTNGSARNQQWWSSLALPGVEIGFALDGLEDVHGLYRIGTDWKKVVTNACAFINAGGHAVWRFIPFDHNRHQEEACRTLARDLGFYKFENIYDGRDTGPVFDRHGTYQRYLGKNVFPNSVPDIKTVTESHLTWFDPARVKSHKDTAELDLFCIHKHNREIYLAADGSVYPCCYLGFYPKTMHHPGNCQTRDIVQQNNALEHDLEHCMAWFDRVEQSWDRPSVAQGRLYQCVNNCNRA